MGQVIFITGTDTGAGKTVFTASLLSWMRCQGLKTLAMKPFCSGRPSDVALFAKVMDHEISSEIINPFHFPEPVAPLISARKNALFVSLSEAIDRIQSLAQKTDYLLVEGAGGLLVPLGERYLVLDVILALNCPVVVVGRNRLGVINQMLLTVRHLQGSGTQRIMAVLLGSKRVTLATETNSAILSEWLHPIPVLEFPFLGAKVSSQKGITRALKKIKKPLAQILAWAIVSAA